ncbi:MAG: hypothetical protein CYPHOPRED_000872 [Cyphobasidiales sp. Tagirdzhanova-0007]|nr:MAG: hypothetical protein CYPHOPRED_000872 [Cyphobasidiales sp. Tagirdzhanova-0007]
MYDATKVSTPKILYCDVPSITISASAELPIISDVITMSHLQRAAAALQADEVVAFPTETVYGLGGSALAGSSAIAKIFKTKGRPADNPLIVHIAHPNQLESVVDPSYKDHLPSCYSVLMERFWPGPLTILFPTLPGRLVSEKVTCGLNTVGVRIPSHPVARALLSLAKVPVAAPSANISGRPSPTTARHVETDLQSASDLACILDGGSCTVGVESTVVTALRNRDYNEGKAAEAGQSGKEILSILRLGGVSPEQLRACLEDAGIADQVDLHVEAHTQAATQASVERNGNAVDVFVPSTPGMKYKHYSPDAKVILLQSGSSEAAQELAIVMRPYHGKNIGLLHMGSSPLSSALSMHLDDLHSVSLGDVHDYESHAQGLFGGLRRFDEAGVDVILVEYVREEGLGRTVMERLRKAAGGSEVVLVRL